MTDSVHKSVLLQETIEGLNLADGAKVVDGTLGGGGHSFEICKRFPNTHIIAIDQDQSTWERAKAKVENCKISFHNGNFRDIDTLLAKEGAEKVDGIMLDLGLSSDQLENSGRGFSFMKDELLVMTMKENPDSEDLMAGDIVNGWSEESLADIIYGYGEEKFSRRIAKAITEARKRKPIETTGELSAIIGNAVPGGYKRGKIHYATRTFQALRIATNDELRTLEKGLEKGFEALKNGGRLAVISFHSLEDRIVKNFYKKEKAEGRANIITKKPVTAGQEELHKNPRARSAKLRILQKIK